MTTVQLDADKTPVTKLHVPPECGTDECAMALTDHAGADGKGPPADTAGITARVNR